MVKAGSYLAVLAGALLLAMVWHLEREPESVVVRAYDGAMSDALAIARRALAAGIPAKRDTLVDAMHSASPLLQSGPS